MRKYIREIMRNNARKQKIKPSKWVRSEFDRKQVKKFGLKRRTINKAKGTHKRSIWKQRTEGLMTEPFLKEM